MPTKADLIREYLGKHPDMRPTEVAKKISAEHNIQVSVQDVSGVRIKDEHRRKRAQREAPPPPARVEPLAQTGPKPRNEKGIAEAVAKLKEVVELLGREEVKKLVDLL